MEDAFSPAVSAACLVMACIGLAVKAARDAISQAIKATKQTVSELIKLPKFFVIKSLTPTIFGFDCWCLATRPDWFVLSYNGVNSPQTDINRAWMRTTYAAFWANTPPGLSVDEFPYASTEEGGAGGPACVTYVPRKPRNENSIQGGYLGAFQRFSRLKGKPGAFLVVPIPI